MKTYPRATKENLSKYVARIRADAHWYENEYIRYYAANDMQSHEAMKVNGYWLTKEGEILSKGETLNERWIINDQRVCPMCSDGFGRLPDKDIESYINCPKNYPDIDGRNTFNKYSAMLAKTDLQARDEMVQRLNSTSTRNDTIDQDKIIAWRFKIITPQKHDEYGIYRLKFKLNNYILLQSCLNGDQSGETETIFVITDLLEIRNIHYSEKTNKFFFVKIDTNNLNYITGELSPNRHHYTAWAINVSGRRVLSNKRIDERPDWWVEKSLTRKESIVTDRWLIFYDIKSEEQFGNHSTYLTPFNDYLVSKGLENKRDYLAGCKTNNDDEIARKILMIDEDAKINRFEMSFKETNELEFPSKFITPQKPKYKEACDEYNAEFGNIILKGSLFINNAYDIEYDGFIINKINEVRKCEIHKSGKYSIYDGNGNIIKRDYLISDYEKREIEEYKNEVIRMFKELTQYSANETPR